MNRYLQTLLVSVLSFTAQVAMAGPYNRMLTKPPETASTGTPVYVDGKTRIEYLPWTRVWSNVEGDFEVCPHTATADPDKLCYPGSVLPRTAAERSSAWMMLADYKQVGYDLKYVQVNETPKGPSLVLYWYPTKAVLDADRLKHK